MLEPNLDDNERNLVKIDVTLIKFGSNINFLISHYTYRAHFTIFVSVVASDPRTETVDMDQRNSHVPFWTGAAMGSTAIGLTLSF